MAENTALQEAWQEGAWQKEAWQKEAWQKEAWREELVNGEIVMMASPSLNHGRVSKNLCYLFERYLRGQTSEYFPDGTDLFLTDKDRFVPDGMLVCDPSKSRGDGVHGAPDLVVEILSPSTSKRDRIYKKGVYASCGVREYWLVNPMDRSVEQYVQENGQLTLRDVFQLYPDFMLQHMTEAEKAALVTSFHCTLFDDLTIRLEDIFYRVSVG